MLYKIQTTIESIDQLLDWYKKYKPEQYRQQFDILSLRRSELRDMQDTLQNLPAIAAYGESQKGKSYLIGNLLKKDGKPFMVSSPEGSFDFVDHLNPIGDGQEATGVVTRLSSFRLNSEKYDRRYPVIMKVFSIADLVCVLSDGIHNDVINNVQYSDEELKKCGDDLLEKYSDQPVRQKAITQDDVIKILRYLNKFVPQAQNIVRNKYLQKLALVIQSVPLEKMATVFEPLWIDHGYEDVSPLFSRLLNLLQRLGFAKEVYLPIDSISHQGIKNRTIMSVDCLKGLYQTDFPHKTNVYIKKADGDFTCLKDIDRSELSALCEEIVIKIDDAFLEGNMTISTENISPNVKRELAGMPDITKAADGKGLNFSRNLLQYCDLLDFPGARSRESLLRETLLKQDQKNKFCNIIKIILRGKVAFLFNNYSISQKVNMLMFCHDKANVEVTQMYLTIQDWVNRHVGTTPEKREEYIRANNGIAPLFVISTKLNLDMVKDTNDTANNENALNQRWNGRFSLLHQDGLQVTTNNWFQNWTKDSHGKTASFKNTYMLRDFKYSACSGKGNNLYDGFNPKDPNPSEKKLVLPEDFYKLLKATFMDEETTDTFFVDPADSTNKLLKEMAWDLSASINNDGAAWIIYNMTRGAEHLEEIRKKNLQSQIDEIVEAIYKTVDDLYERDDTNDPKGELRKLSNILFSLISTCNSDNSFFGRMINAMQLKSKETYIVVHDALNNPTLVTTPATHKKGELFRKLVEKYPTRDEKLKKLIEILGFSSEKEASEKLAQQGVDLNFVIGEVDVPKETVSDLVAREVMEHWRKKMLSSGLLDTISMDDESSATVPSLITGRMVNLAEGLGLKAIASEAVSQIVNVTNINNVNESQVADIIKNIINGFVTDWGYSYRSTHDIEKIKEMDKVYDLSIEESITKADAQSAILPDLDSLADIFDEVSQGPDAITSSFNNNFFRWVACMKTGFVCKTAKSSGPAHGIEANNAIGRIYQEVKDLNAH